MLVVSKTEIASTWTGTVLVMTYLLFSAALSVALAPKKEIKVASLMSKSSSYPAHTDLLNWGRPVTMDIIMHVPLTAATPSSHQQPRPCLDLQVRKEKKSNSCAEDLLYMGIGFFFLLVEALQW